MLTLEVEFLVNGFLRIVGGAYFFGFNFWILPFVIEERAVDEIRVGVCSGFCYFLELDITMILRNAYIFT